jgi:hypothetical protein
VGLWLLTNGERVRRGGSGWSTDEGRRRGVNGLPQVKEGRGQTSIKLNKDSLNGEEHNSIPFSYIFNFFFYRFDWTKAKFLVLPGWNYRGPTVVGDELKSTKIIKQNKRRGLRGIFWGNRNISIYRQLFCPYIYPAHPQGWLISLLALPIIPHDFYSSTQIIHTKCTGHSY